MTVDEANAIVLDYYELSRRCRRRYHWGAGLWRWTYRGRCAKKVWLDVIRSGRFGKLSEAEQTLRLAFDADEDRVSESAETWRHWTRGQQWDD